MSQVKIIWAPYNLVLVRVVITWRMQSLPPFCPIPLVGQGWKSESDLLYSMLVSNGELPYFSLRSSSIPLKLLSRSVCFSDYSSDFNSFFYFPYTFSTIRVLALSIASVWFFFLCSFWKDSCLSATLSSTAYVLKSIFTNLLANTVPSDEFELGAFLSALVVHLPVF